MFYSIMSELNEGNIKIEDVDVLKNMNVKAIIFDLDGTLVDSKVDYGKMKKRIIRVFEDSGVKPGILSEFMLNFQIEALAMEHLRKNNVADEEIQSLFHKITNIMNEVELEGVESAILMKGVKETLSNLKRLKVKLGVVTRGCREYTVAILKNLALKIYFDSVVARDDVSNPKPHPEHLQKAMRLLGVKASDTVLVGDNLFLDGLCANHANIKFVWFNRSGTPKKVETTISNVRIDYEIGSLQELLKIISI